MKNKKLLGGFVAVIILIIIGVVYFNGGLNSESGALLKEVDQKGLQKFIDDHNISKDDILNEKVGPYIETGQREWVAIAAQMYYGNVVTHDAGFNESLNWYLSHAVDKNPLVVFQTINS